MSNSKKIKVKSANLDALTKIEYDENGNIIRKSIRSEEEKQLLRSRLNRIIGQIKGIVNMIEEDRYCEDVLIQLVSSYKSIRSVTDIMLCDHLVACVKEGMEQGKYDMLDEAMKIFKRYQ